MERLDKRLEDEETTIQDVADETGVGYQWLVKVAARSIKNPGVHQVQKLYDGLKAS